MAERPLRALSGKQPSANRLNARLKDQFGDRRSLEAGSYLTADNKMTRKPNFALNAEMKAVAERLTLPAVLVHFFRFAPTAIE